MKQNAEINHPQLLAYSNRKEENNTTEKKLEETVQSMKKLMLENEEQYKKDLEMLEERLAKSTQKVDQATDTDSLEAKDNGNLY